MTDIVERLRTELAITIKCNDDCHAEIKRLRARIALLEKEARIGADRLLIASGVCREWADRMRAMDGHERPHRGNVECEGRPADTASRLDP